MSWQDDARDLLAMGATQDSYHTTLFIASVKAVQARRGADLDHAVSLLPPSCRGQANGILHEARASGLSDLQIVAQLCALTDDQPTMISSSTDPNDWASYEGMAGNPF